MCKHCVSITTRKTNGTKRNHIRPDQMGERGASISRGKSRRTAADVVAGMTKSGNGGGGDGGGGGGGGGDDVGTGEGDGDGGSGK
jgi:hypothetical protein